MIVSSLTNCVIMPHYETLTGKISGRVMDAKEQPVSGAQVEFLFRSGRQLGSTFTSRSGSFELGPFRQWFYVTYIGSPGVYPFPYTLEHHGLPHVLRVRHMSNTALYMLGDESDFKTQRNADYPGLRIDLPRDGRWAGSQPVKLIIAPGMQDSVLPKHARRDLPKPTISPTQP